MQKKTDDIDQSIQFVVQHYQPDVFDTTEGWKKLTHKLPGYRKVRPISVATRVAAAVVLLLISGIALWMTVNRPHQLMAEADNSAFTLPDRTEIVMQEGAELKYDRHFGDQERRVSMQGDIRFAVARDEEKPFIVSTPSAQITVLGTVFNVSNNDQGTSLSVQSGKVLFTPESPAVEIICTKGMRVHYQKKDKEIHVFSDNASILYSADRNELSITNAPIGQLLMLLSQYYNVKIEAPEAELPLLITSSFSGKSIIEIVNIINYTLDSHITIVD